MFEDLAYKNGRLYRDNKEVGWLQQNGYRMFSYKNKKYLVHRVIWYLHYNKWPSEIDHINQKRSDNRICNLREVSHSINLRNQKKIKGYHRVGKKYRAMYTRDNKSIHIGMFKTAKEARQAYLNITKE